MWTNVEDVGPTLYKCYTNVLCFLGTAAVYNDIMCIFLYLFLNICIDQKLNKIKSSVGGGGGLSIFLINNSCILHEINVIFQELLYII